MLYPGGARLLAACPLKTKGFFKGCNSRGNRLVATN
jgi:hypothetical protein